jgi:hypothetical protein
MAEPNDKNQQFIRITQRYMDKVDQALARTMPATHEYVGHWAAAVLFVTFKGLGIVRRNHSDACLHETSFGDLVAEMCFQGMLENLPLSAALREEVAAILRPRTKVPVPGDPGGSVPVPRPGN